MKKRLVRTRMLALLLLLLFLFAACARHTDDASSEPAPEESIPTAEYRLPARIQLKHWDEIEQFDVQYDGETMTFIKGNGSKEVVEVDERGRLRESYTYNADGDCTYHRAYEYDADGNTVVQIVYEPDGSERGRLLHTYSADGLLLKTVNTDSGRRIYRSTVYEYDAGGRKSKATEYDMIGDVSNVREYTYDANGNLALETYRYADGTIGAQTEYEYDEHGNLTKEDLDSGFLSHVYTYTNEYDGNGRLTATDVYYDDSWWDRDEYEYGSDGKLQKKISYTEDGAVYHINTYDAGGNVTEEISYSEGEIWLRVKHTYDEAGHEIRYAIDSGDGDEVVHWTREYDENGRLVLENDYTHPTYGLIQTVYTDHDANGNPAQAFQYVFLDIEALTEYTYDEGGRLLTRVASNRDGDLLEREEFTYDADGREIKQTIYNESNEVINIYESSYDENGIQTKRYYLSDGKLARLCEYDADGRMLKQEDYYRYSDIIESAHEWEYGADGVLVREVVTHRYGDGYIYEFIVYEYDESGRLTNRNQYSSFDRDSYSAETDRFRHTAYQYDEQGDFLREVCYPDGESGVVYRYSVTERCTVTLTEAQYRQFLAYIDEQIDYLKEQY